MAQRLAGIISLNVNGQLQNVKGNFTYNLGRPKREAVVGSDGLVHGYKETPQIPFIEGEVSDRSDLDLNAMVTMADGTVTLTLAVGKVIALNNAFFAAEGTGNTEEGNIGVRWEGETAEEVA